MRDDVTPGNDREPRLSVVIGCLNAEHLLGVQLAALERQECPVPWEVIVADNGSTDGTVALARSWAGRLPLRVVDAAEIRGAGPARNAGVEAARGEWIGFCDADDEVGEGWLAALCSALAEHPFVAGRFEAYRLNSRRTVRSRGLDQQVGLQHSSAVVGLSHAGAGNLGIHRSVFEAVGGFDPRVRYLQDTDLCWRVQLAGYPLVFVPDLVVHVRLRSTLRDMYRQGYNYGVSQADLDRRYAGAASRLATVRPPLPVGGTGLAESSSAPLAAPMAGTDDADPLPADRADAADALPGPAPGGRSAARNLRGAVRLAAFFVRNRSSLGAQVWQIGWHLGNRRAAGE